MADRTSASTRVVAPGELLRELEARAAAPPRTVAPSHSRRRRRRFGAAGAVVGAALLAIALVVPALAVHNEQFQLDGNTAVDTPPASGPFANTIYDWESLFHDNTPGSTAAEPALTLPATFGSADFVQDWSLTAGKFDTSDPTTFTGGSSKDENDVSAWKCVGANQVTDKGDITNAYAGIYDNGSDRILYFGMEKTAGQGDNNVGLWILQDPNVGCPPDSPNPGQAFSGTHMDGDLFIVSEFTNGAAVSSVKVYKWDSGAASLLTSGVDCSATAPDDSVCATTNLDDIDPQWDHYSKDDGVNGVMPAATFYEGGINLNDFPEFKSECFNGFLFNTRSSQELTAELYDYALGNISTCKPQLSLEKTPDGGTHFVGDFFDWTIAVSNTGDAIADDAVVTDTIPAGLHINSATPGNGSCVVDLQVVTCTIDVPIGGTVNIAVNVTALGSAVTDEDGCNNIINTASVTGDEDTSDNSDTGNVDVCEVQVTKDASTSYDLDYDWTIEKSADPATWDLFQGDSGTSDWIVDVHRDGGTKGNFAVNGTITVHNPAPIAVTIDSVADVLSIDGAVNVDCGATVFPFDLDPGLDLVCTYDSATADDTTQTNTATATIENTPSGTTGFDGTASVDFANATVTELDATATASDTNGQNFGTVVDGSHFSYPETFDCDADKGVHTNTATVVEGDSGDSHSDDATVTVNCYDLHVSKDADGHFRRTYHWTINKTSDVSGTLTLNPGEIYMDYPYKVTVGLADPAYTDDHYSVSGSITVHNPAPIAATINSVEDVLSVDGNAAVDCGVTFPYSLAASSDLHCTYSKDIGAATDQTNTATAELQNHDYDQDGVGTPSGTTDYTGTASVTFGGPTNVVDETVHVVDDYGTPGDPSDDIDFGNLTVGVDTLPHTFTYNRTFGPYTAEQCGEHVITNTATFETTDTHTTGSDDHTVTITVPCNTGCTLTQGYWKTHSVHGPAKPADSTWDLIGGPDQAFFISGQTWYQVFWTAPKGGNAYYILAHQYEAAVLNIASGADSTAQVDATITAATAWFGTHTPTSTLSKAERNQLISWAGILGSYNTGTTGPGHCSEDAVARSAPA